MFQRRTALTAVLTTTALLVPTAAEATPRPVPALDREVVFTVEGTKTYGTLHVPAHRRGQRLPAALLLPGSGPTDRDGNQPPAVTPHTLSHLAAALGRQGVVTLRFDKYGSGRTGLGAYASRPGDLDHPAFVRQAAAAYRLLRAEPVTDPRALVVAGHSEGALTGLLLADEVRPRPAGVVLLQPQAIRLLDLIARQLHAQLAAAARGGQITPEQQRVNDEGVDRAVSALRSGEPLDPTGLLPVIAQFFQALSDGPSRRFVLGNDQVDPSTAAGRLRAGTRVLLTCGTADVQVPCDTTDSLAEALRRAGAAGPGRTVLTGVDHNLRGTDPNTLAPAVVDALRAFTDGLR
ncbi:alpha/beta fold hydrolase [Saccharothrix sp. 6-C]|uniref:alpha/beta hydrolase family protein n=1 Tax=Saccharothrix sp. 6-C TaxID=2781735 RepID=UPI0019175698|nr:alpha/beta fold hydrolase [Saccharothrix sp. 6-C]QQQ73893.1 alpha/beta fold hydrolase [Saccharothrix sp. 6-C]